jgi:sugar/nucleoside kinase (ribokinase family)
VRFDITKNHFKIVTKKFDVLVAGELNVDLILNGLDQFPETGKEVLAKKMLLTLGSSSAIFASNLAVLGSRVAFCGKIGIDSFGNKILEDLSSKNVDTSYITTSAVYDTGITVCLSFDEDRANVTYPGAMVELTADDITDNMLRAAKHLHVSSIFLQPGLKETISSVFERAHLIGLTTSLDPQWDPEEKWHVDWKKILPNTDIFLPNIEEIKAITKQSNAEDCISSIKKFSNNIVIKNGKKGGIIWDGKKTFIQPAFINYNVADAIGAGDSFNAGFIHSFVQQKPLQQCAEFGALCGAINTTKGGGTTAFSDLGIVKKIAQEKFNYHIDDA